MKSDYLAKMEPGSLGKRRESRVIDEENEEVGNC